MENNSRDCQETAQEKCCNCSTRRTKLLILAIALNFTITGCLLIAHLYQRNELLEFVKTSGKEIADCRRRHVALINSKRFHEGAMNERRNNELNQRKVIRKSPEQIKLQKKRKTKSQQAVNSYLQRGCPYRSRKRRKICSFVITEVSRQLNLTKIRKALEAESPVVYFNSLGTKNQRILKPFPSGQLSGQKRSRYTYLLQWDVGGLKDCNNKKNLQWCRLTRKSENFKNRLTSTKVNIPVAGVYFVYCQLAFTVNDTKGSKNVAHLISNVNIVMSKRLNANEDIRLISQVPVMTGQGNERVVTVSMFTQAYLYKESQVRVTFTLRDKSIPKKNKELDLYSPRREKQFNVFGMHLLKKTDDGKTDDS